jgi:hypothetical protein
MSQTYTHAGVSQLNGEYKVRFCNDALRTKTLQKNGHKNIDIVELKHPMTKAAAVAALRVIMRDSSKAVQAALDRAEERLGLPEATEGVAAAVTTGAKKEQRPNRESKKPPKPKAESSAAAPDTTLAAAVDPEMAPF